MNKLDRAMSIIEKARALGCEPTIQGNWVVFKPSLPVDLMVEAVDLGDELVAALK